MLCSELLQFYNHRKTTFPFSKRSDSDEKVADKLSTGLRTNPLFQTLPGKWNYEQEEMFSSREQKQSMVQRVNSSAILERSRMAQKIMYVYGKDA